MKSNLTNYHSHCDFCDGSSVMEDFVLAAISHGFSAYGISSHAPLPDYAGAQRVLQIERVDQYLAEITRLKAKYADRIEIYAGLEIDYIDSGHNPANDYYQSLPLDFRIGAVHFVKTGPETLMNADTRHDKFAESLALHYDNDINRLVTDYFGAKRKMVAAGGIDFVAHTDKVSLNANKFKAGLTSERWYRQMIGEYFEFIASKETVLEVNTKLLDTTGYTFPNQEHFGLLRQLNIPVVVNSDTHQPQLVNAGREQTIELLRKAGYRTIRELHAREWQEIKI